MSINTTFQPLKAVIISDLHLSDDTPELMQRFLQMLEVLPRHCEQFFILGDLVDFWPGDDAKEAYSTTIKQALQKLTDAGVKTYLQHGNRDFLFSHQFEQECGITLLPDYCLADLAGQSTLLMHGDLLCTDDIDYLNFRKLVHMPWLRPLWHFIPMFIRRKIIKKVQLSSRSKTQYKSENIIDANIKTVTDTMSEYKVKCLIHGHTHRPQIHNIIVDSEPAQRLVLGDWGSHYWWIEVGDNRLQLKKAELSTDFALPNNTPPA